MSRKKKSKQQLEHEKPFQLPNIKPKTLNQENYLNSIRKNKITFCLGPAGTGKTILATRMAIDYFMQGLVSKLVLTRPTIEAEKTLGFLPGDLSKKLDPFLRPILDEMEDHANIPVFKKLREEMKVESCSIGMMRGRNFHNAFILVDEAQNVTFERLLLALTRFGKSSKMVINGDPSQTDLSNREQGGLLRMIEILDGLDGIGIVKLNKEDVMREEIVAAILDRVQNINPPSHCLT
jgi:phosphate starvation-inducible PhoH-like protein